MAKNISQAVANGNRKIPQPPAKIKLVPKTVPDVKIEARSKSPDLMIMSVTKPTSTQQGLSPSKMKTLSQSVNGNSINGTALPQPVMGNITQKPIIPSSSKSTINLNTNLGKANGGGAVVQNQNRGGAVSTSPSLKQVTKSVSSVSPSINQSVVNFSDYAKNMVTMSQQPQSIGNQSTNQVVNLIQNPMANMVSGGHPDVGSIIQPSKGLTYNFNQTRNMFQVYNW